MKYLRWMMMFVIMLLAAGCSAPEDDDATSGGGADEPERTESEDKQSAAGQVVDQVTGIKAAKEGQKLKNKIGEIEEQRNRQIEETYDQE
ncbi:MAG: hypothetical protein ACOCWJ_00850 [Verrucomicrobiota bacterium]